MVLSPMLVYRGVLYMLGCPCLLSSVRLGRVCGSDVVSVAAECLEADGDVIEMLYSPHEGPLD